MKDIRRILVTGFATRHVAESASRAGIEVVAVDHFCDRDLKACTIGCVRFEELEEIPDLVKRCITEFSVDAVIATSGAEDLQNLKIPLLGSDPIVAARFLDKAATQMFFEKHGFPVPTQVSRGVFPAMLKPCKGSGGWRNRLVTSDEDIRRWEEEFDGEPYLLQEFAPGIPASVCCVVADGKAKVIAANLQILRGTEEARFGFCGSLTPFIHPMTGSMCEMAEAIAAFSGCQGIIGIDFLVTDTGVYPIEINPRFVATLDTIERATGCNLVRIHIDAFAGKLPDVIPEPKVVSIRQILFSPEDLTMQKDLSGLIPAVADIPAISTRFETGDAVISVYGEGPDEASAREALDKTIKAVCLYMG